MAVKQWNGKPLSLKVIGTNAGTSMDGLDIAPIQYTQESPDAPLKMRLLREGEVAFDGALKSNCCERHFQKKRC
jgi:1,6-anhydro-N-acetylmuramate kinase